MYVSGKTTRSARLVAASRMRPMLFWTVFAVSRKTGATLQAASTVSLLGSVIDYFDPILAGNPDLW